MRRPLNGVLRVCGGVNEIASSQDETVATDTKIAGWPAPLKHNHFRRENLGV